MVFHFVGRPYVTSPSDFHFSVICFPLAIILLWLLLWVDVWVIFNERRYFSRSFLQTQYGAAVFYLRSAPLTWYCRYITAREPTFMRLWASNSPCIKVNSIVITCFHDIQSWRLYPVPPENLVLDPGNIRPIDIYDQTGSETLAIIQFKVLGENLFINILEVRFS